MGDIPQTMNPVSEFHWVGVVALVSGVISTFGVVFLIAMFVLFATQRLELGNKVGSLNDVCVALQYLLTIPIALALHRMLSAYNPLAIRIATILGIVSMLTVFGLQLLLILRVLTFEQQVLWVSLALILGVGSWLMVTGLTARYTGGLPHSLVMSAIAVPYFGYPVWALWIGLHLLAGIAP
jgi:hypothetical protein